MDFFAKQDQARRGTLYLLVLFLLAALVLILTTDAALVGFFPFYFTDPPPGFAVSLRGWSDFYRLFLLYPHGSRLAVLSGGVAWFILLVSFYKVRELAKGGGRALAAHIGGKPVPRDSPEPRERVLLNVVEEMALASGVPVPEVYILRNEPAINAFAAGFGVEESVIGVTQGTLDTLNRDELQGVIAHEFSHILNGDMRLNMRMIGILHGIFIIAIAGRTLRDFGRSGRRNSRISLLGLVLSAIGYGGFFLGLMIQAAISRERELLADASAVQFTRNPEGIRGALRKIAADANGSFIRTSLARGMRHMFFAISFSTFWQRLFATHPTVRERLQSLGLPLDPGEKDADGAGTDGTLHSYLSTEAAASGVAFAAAPRGVLTPREVVATVGTVTPANLESAQSFLSGVPAVIRDAARSPEGAASLVCATLLDLKAAVRLPQLELLRSGGTPEELDRIENFAGLLGQLDPAHLLPLIGLALPSLRQLPAGARDRLLARSAALADADGKITPFEYTLTSLLRRRLLPAAPPKAVLQSRAMQSLETWRPQFAALLAAVDGTSRDFKAFDTALQALANAPYKIRKAALDACAACAAKDGKVTFDELNLVRAVADVLACPMPFPA